MKKYILSVMLFLCIFSSAFAFEATHYDFRRTFQYYVGVGAYNGDSKGDFVGDPLAVLSDGSVWKIHPKDREKFSRWLANEILHPEIRTTFYFIKREHKFCLQNHMRNESVRAMLVQYPTYPLMIVDAQTYIADTRVYMSEHRNADGTVTQVPRIYQVHEKRIVLNDGTIWKIRDKFEHFNIGSTVYLGCNNLRGEKYRFFLISGIERYAEHQWAKY